MCDVKCRIEYYIDSRGHCPYDEFLNELETTGKHKEKLQVESYVELLRYKGNEFMVGTKYVKHIEGDLWELRPGRNRILYVLINERKIIILHGFLKKDKAQQQKEIKKAQREMQNC